VDVAKAVLTIHRDFGDRTDRKHARLKYVVADREWISCAPRVNQRAGIKLEAARPTNSRRWATCSIGAESRGRLLVPWFIRSAWVA